MAEKGSRERQVERKKWTPATIPLGARRFANYMQEHTRSWEKGVHPAMTKVVMDDATSCATDTSSITTGPI